MRPYLHGIQPCRKHILFKKPSLTSRIAISVTLLVVAVMLLVTLVSYAMMKQRIKQLVAQQQAVLVTTAAGELDQKFSVRSKLLMAMAGELGKSLATPAGDPRWQEYLSGHAEQRVLFANLALFGRNGDTLANLNQPDRRGSANAVGRPYFDQTVQERRPVVSAPTLGLFTRVPVVVMTAPVLDAGGNVALVLTGVLNLQAENFISGLTQAHIGRSGYFSILATDGTIIGPPAPSAATATPAGSHPAAERQALAGFEGSVEGVDRQGVRGLYSFKRITGAPWILTAFFPESEAFAALLDIERNALIVTLVLLALMIPLAWLLVSRQLQPLQTLHARILAVRQEPTLALVPRRYSRDEIGEMADNFDSLMRDRLFVEARYQSGAEELRAATNSGLDAFFIFQAERNDAGRVADFSIRYLNANAEKMLGQTLAVLAQGSLRRSLGAHPVAAMLPKLIDVLDGGVALQEEICMEGLPCDSQGGSGARWYQLQFVPQADGVVLTARDITDRKHDELEIRSNRAFLQSLTDHLPMLFYAKRIDADGNARLVTWNRAAESITGLTSDQVLGKSDRELHPASVAAAYEAHDRHILAHPVPLDVPEMRFHRADGSLRYLHVVSVPIFDQHGQVEYIIGIGEDITERRQQERQLRANRAELEAVNDSSPLGLFRTDVAGNCLYLNRTYERLAGVQSQQLLDDAWFGSLHPQDRDPAIALWVTAIHLRQPYHGIHRFLHADGAVLWGSFKAVPMTVDGQITGYVGSVDDITERRKIEQALRESEQRLRLVTDNIPALISYVTPDQRFRFGNRKYQDAFGLVDPEMSGLSAAEVLGADVYAQSQPYIEGALMGVPANFERLVTHVGQLRWERVSYIPDVDDAEVVGGFFSLVEDITELKQAQHTFAKSEMRLRMITDNLPALIAYIDADGRYRFCNGYYETVLGLKPEKILGQRVEDVVGKAGYAAVAAQMQMVLSGQRVSFERHAVAAGIDRHFLYDYIPDFGLDGSVTGFYSMVLDITARKTAELKQAASENLLRTLTDNLPALVGFIDREEMFRFNNQVYAEWLKKPLAEITGRSMREVYGEPNYLEYKPYFDQALQGRKVEFEFEASRDGVRHYFRAAYAPQVDADGGTSGVCSMISDITALKQVENQLRVLARFDSLTGLPNRNQFEEKLAEAIARSRRNKRTMAVMFLDIDHFKQINDTIGHHGGDAVLREFALRLQHCVRKTDTVSRLAGDEFTIILEGLQSDDESAMVAGKIIQAMEQPFTIGDEVRKVTTSIGIAVRRTDEINPEALLRRADEALYGAKAAGRNTFESMV